ncbi:Bystin [Smittium culicis]|uniref:Bystin n=1 Tax=Smittium culicis TaxID=133412 RepID=A0A1R1YJK1_9FUNG|nr:Bystin [Smittium culicis]
MPRITKDTKAKLGPLHESYVDSDIVYTNKPSRAKFVEREKKRDKKGNDSSYVEPKLTGKILETARKQQQEIENELINEEKLKNRKKSAKNAESEDFSDFPSDEEIKDSFKPRNTQSSYNDSDDDSDDMDENYGDYSDMEFQVDAKDAAIFEKLMPSAPQKRQNLADIISAKINEFNKSQTASDQSDIKSKQNGKDSLEKMKSQINPKVVQVYTQ